MPFREKSAWVMAVIIIITAGLYAALVAPMPGSMLPLPVVIVCIVVLAVLSVFGQIAIAVFSPKDAGAAADERDRRVAEKASSIAGTVLTVGVVIALGMYVIGHGGHALFHAVFASLVIAQFAEYALTIRYYRSGV
jgi:hypothetical protein